VTRTPLFPYTTLFRSRDDHVRSWNVRQHLLLHESARHRAERHAHERITISLAHLVLQIPAGHHQVGLRLVALVKIVDRRDPAERSEEHTSELQSRENL